MSSHKIITRGFESPEVDVDQNKVDDGGAVLVPLVWLEDVAFFQTFAVENLGVDLGKRQLVHPSPFLGQQKLLDREPTPS